MVVVAIVVAAVVYFALANNNTSTTQTVTNTVNNTNTTTVSSATTQTQVQSTTVTLSQSTTSYFVETLQAGGSTFVNPVMQVWAVGFQQFTGGNVALNYQSVGSGAGITGVQTGTFIFGGSDAPHANQTATQGTLLNIPETLGAVAIFYNIPGVTQSLNLTGPILAKIYLENITMWNDPAILALNHGVNATLLNRAIVPVHRSDGSGTTYALTNYFTKVSTDWNASGKGFGTLVNWPTTGELAGKGSSQVATYVQQNFGGIGYADSYYAFSNKLLMASIQNQAGAFVPPSLAGVTAAASAFATQLQANPTFTITNAPGATSYPISTFTYILVWQKQSNYNQAFDTASFIWWVVNQGQGYGPTLFYPTLPAAMVTIDEGLIAQITYNGAPVITAG